MTARQWVISVLIAFHLLAVTLAAIPRGVAGQMRTVPRPDGDPVAALLEQPLTRLADGLNRTQRWLRRSTTMVRGRTQPYISSALPQNWSMFSSVLVVQRYLRVDYYVQAGDRPVTLYQQLVLPSQVEGEPRLFYRSADKAVRVVMGGYLTRLRDEEEGAASSGADDVDAARVIPLVRHFSSRFASAHDIARDQIVRVEVWAGSVPIPPPGEAPTFPAQLRRDMLNRYRTAAPQPAPAERLSLWTMRRQGDLSWQLVYIDDQASARPLS
jgi:hypothetical protein